MDEATLFSTLAQVFCEELLPFTLQVAAMPQQTSRRWLLFAISLVFVVRQAQLHFAVPSNSSSRRKLLGLTGALLIPQNPVAAEEEIPLGSIPTNLKATVLGEKVNTPNGCTYEPLDLGTEETGPRNGPPRGGSTVILKYKAHIDSFDGPVFDSSTLRGQRKPNKVDFVESRLNVDPSLPPCVFEAVKLMKVGAKGRATCPPKLSYQEGKVAFDADESGEVKKVPAGASLYYELELVRIIKP